MSLADRLARLRAQGLLPASESGPKTSGSGADLYDASGLEHLAAALEGLVQVMPSGPVVVVERRYPLAYCHGREPLSGLLEASLDRLAWLADRRLARSGRVPDLRAGQVVFWDTETSGLTGGPGTYVILVGTGRFTPEDFLLRQFVLAHPEAEAPFLEAVAEELRPDRTLVSFNGRAFDGPQLETRFILQRRTGTTGFSGTDRLHLDLLHPARMLYRADLERCTLGQIEARVLGVNRDDDLPGAEVPERYRHYLQDGSPAWLAPILRHNRDDVLSLVGLATVLARRASREDAGDDPPWPGELYGLARAHVLRGDEAGARALYHDLRTRLAPGGRPDAADRGLWYRATVDLALLHKRAGQWQEAEALWRELAGHPDSPTCLPQIELAKILEHRRRDPEGALEVVTATLERAHRRYLLGSRRAGAELADLEHRLRRLAAKVRARIRPHRPA